MLKPPLNPIELQNLVFKQSLTRSELLEAPEPYNPPLKKKIYVLRNHSFELLSKSVGKFLSFSGISPEFTYSDYDDTLQYSNLDVSSDLVIIWLDLNNLDLEFAKEFIPERITALRNDFLGPICLFTLGGDVDLRLEGFQNFTLEGILSKFNGPLVDERLNTLTGSLLSIEATFECSRILGLRILPGELATPIRAIICDLDNTLYSGVLGEDGVTGIVLTDAHRELQNHLKVLSEKGLPLFICSKNDERDVRRLFESQTDFPLGLNDFTQIFANWEDKSQNISRIAEYTNNNPEAFLFIDDNPSEILSSCTNHPGIRTIHAKEDANETLNILKNYPALYANEKSSHSINRKLDLQAREFRATLTSKASVEDLLKQLNVKLDFYINPEPKKNRIFELSNKTNQYVYAYKRFTEKEVSDILRDSNKCVITVDLKDDLSDSGTVAAIFTTLGDDKALTVDEVVISCRALGRGLEQRIVCGAISLAANKLGANHILVTCLPGPRNQPAQKSFAEIFHADAEASYDSKEFVIQSDSVAIEIH